MGLGVAAPACEVVNINLHASTEIKETRQEFEQEEKRGLQNHTPEN